MGFQNRTGFFGNREIGIVYKSPIGFFVFKIGGGFRRSRRCLFPEALAQFRSGLYLIGNDGISHFGGIVVIRNGRRFIADAGSGFSRVPVGIFIGSVDIPAPRVNTADGHGDRFGRSSRGFRRGGQLRCAVKTVVMEPIKSIGVFVKSVVIQRAPARGSIVRSDISPQIEGAGIRHRHFQRRFFGTLKGSEIRGLSRRQIVGFIPPLYQRFGEFAQLGLNGGAYGGFAVTVGEDPRKRQQTKDRHHKSHHGGGKQQDGSRTAAG